MGNEIYRSSDSTSSEPAPSLVSFGNESLSILKSSAIAEGASETLSPIVPAGAVDQNGDLNFGPPGSTVAAEYGKSENSAIDGKPKRIDAEGEKPPILEKPEENFYVNIEPFADGVLVTNSNPPLDIEQMFGQAHRYGYEKELVEDINAKLKREESPYRIDLTEPWPGNRRVSLYKTDGNGQRELVDICGFTFSDKRPIK